MKKTIKRITAILLILAITVSFAGCGEVAKAEKVVNNTFKALQKADFEEISKYIDLDELFPDNTISESDTESVESQELVDKLFGSLQYEIVSSEKIDKETVMFKVKVTTIDMKPVMAEFMKDLLAYSFANAFADPQPTEEETNKATMDMLLECLSAEDLEFVTNEIDIKVVKVDKDWKIDANEDMADVLVGGMISAIEELAESFQEIE